MMPFIQSGLTAGPGSFAYVGDFLGGATLDFGKADKHLHVVMMGSDRAQGTTPLAPPTVDGNAVIALSNRGMSANGSHRMGFFAYHLPDGGNAALAETQGQFWTAYRMTGVIDPDATKHVDQNAPFTGSNQTTLAIDALMMCGVVLNSGSYANINNCDEVRIGSPNDNMHGVDFAMSAATLTYAPSSGSGNIGIVDLVGWEYDIT
jgi:hypothetical protein